MKVLFNHIAKCGGSTINTIAKEEYGDDFHRLTPKTETNELKEWLKKERLFITSEMVNVSHENIRLLLNSHDLKKIILSRDPVERFQSFCGHSTRKHGQGREEGACFWHHEKIIKQPMSANAWLKSCISRMQHILYDKDNCYKLYGIDSGWTFSIYSQWLLASFQSYFDYERGKSFYLGARYQREHIVRWRSKPTINNQIREFLVAHYHAWGTTSDIALFVNTLSELGIFSSEKMGAKIQIKNSSQLTQAEDDSRFAITENLVAEYYALLPEEFLFHGICRDLAKKQWDKLDTAVQ